MDKITADNILRIAGAFALLYYPEAAADDPNYDLAGDVDRILADLDPGERAPLEELTARVILDPTGTRDAFTAAVHDLIADD